MQEFHFEFYCGAARIPVGEAVTLESLAAAYRLGYRLMRIALATVDLPTGKWVLAVRGKDGSPLLHIMLPQQRVADLDSSKASRSDAGADSG
jgi:hypothetical protein